MLTIHPCPYFYLQNSYQKHRKVLLVFLDYQLHLWYCTSSGESSSIELQTLGLILCSSWEELSSPFLLYSHSLSQLYWLLSQTSYPKLLLQRPPGHWTLIKGQLWKCSEKMCQSMTSQIIQIYKELVGPSTQPPHRAEIQPLLFFIKNKRAVDEIYHLPGRKGIISINYISIEEIVVWSRVPLGQYSNRCIVSWSVALDLFDRFIAQTFKDWHVKSTTALLPQEVIQCRHSILREKPTPVSIKGSRLQ